MIKVIDFQPGHLDFLEKREIFQSDKTLDDRVFSFWDAKLPTKTFIHNNKVIAVVGLVKLHNGTADVWSITSEDIKDCRVAFHKCVKNLLDAYTKSEKIHRVQMSVRSDYGTGHRWAESLGFEKEGLMKMYGPDKTDYYLYARYQ